MSGQNSGVSPRKMGVPERVAVECVGSSRCAGAPLPDAPVPLCAYHLRRVYEFADDLVRAWQRL